jgi:hypothetical protein
LRNLLHRLRLLSKEQASDNICSAMTSQQTELPELPDAILERMNMTRERWEQIRAEQRVREARAPAIGDPAPDFELPYLGDKAGTVRLSDFRGERPVALIFGSYT